MGGSGYSALIGLTIVRNNDLPGNYDGSYAAANNPPPISEILSEANRALVNTFKMEPLTKDVLIDGRYYFSLSRRDPWYCESFLTTYSNLDNNHTVVGRSSARGGGEQTEEEGGGQGAGGSSTYPPPPQRISYSPTRPV